LCKRSDPPLDTADRDLTPAPSQGGRECPQDTLTGLFVGARSRRRLALRALGITGDPS